MATFSLRHEHTLLEDVLRCGVLLIPVLRAGFDRALDVLLVAHAQAAVVHRLRDPRDLHL